MRKIKLTYNPRRALTFISVFTFTIMALSTAIFAAFLILIAHVGQGAMLLSPAPLSFHYGNEPLSRCALRVRRWRR